MPVPGLLNTISLLLIICPFVKSPEHTMLLLIIDLSIYSPGARNFSVLLILFLIFLTLSIHSFISSSSKHMCQSGPFKFLEIVKCFVIKSAPAATADAANHLELE